MRMENALTLLLTACFIATAPMGATAQIAEPEVLAKVSAGQYGVEWYPTVDYESVTLTVSGPDGEDYRSEFASNEYPFFDFYGEKDRLRPDGVYMYELTISPVLDPQTRKALSVLRDWKDRETITDRFRKKGALPERELKQSGTFSLHGGKILLADASALEVSEGSDLDVPSENKDILHLDDVIIDFSLCVGTDCVNGENFGFDTIRLKENNLRIHFDDTSNSGSFPRNDWTIIANDSSNGGASYLGIQDRTAGRIPFRVEAGARENALYVEGDGDIGIGTPNPVVDVHTVAGDTPTLRLDQDNSSGFTAQAWDLAGNESNFFLRDVSNGSKLPFRVQPSAPENSLTLRANNRVGMGTWSPETDVHLRRTNGSAIIRIENTGNGNFSGIELTRERQSGSGKTGGAIWLTSDTTSNNSDLILQSNTNTAVGNPVTSDGKRLTLSTTSGFLFENGNVGIGTASAPGSLLVVGTGGAVCNGTTWIDGSSRDFKKNIEDLSEEDLTDLFTVLDEVDLVKFQYRNEDDGAAPRVGMIAEEMPEVLASEDRKGMELGRHVGFLMGVVKAMHEENKKMFQEISELKSQVEILKTDRQPDPEM